MSSTFIPNLFFSLSSGYLNAPFALFVIVGILFTLSLPYAAIHQAICHRRHSFSLVSPSVCQPVLSVERPLLTLLWQCALLSVTKVLAFFISLSLSVFVLAHVGTDLPRLGGRPGLVVMGSNPGAVYWMHIFHIDLL